MRAKHFILTKNNYSDKDIDRLKWLGERIEAENINYIGYVKDIAPKTGTPHLHIYVEFSRYKKSNKTIKRQFFECDVRAITSQSHKYNGQRYIKSKKDEAVEYGKITEQGQRTDIINLHTDVPIMKADGMTLYEIYQELKPNWQQLGIIKEIVKNAPPYQPSILPTNIWIHGESETGKTQLVYDTWKADDIHPANHRWLGEGLGNQKVFLLDDITVETVQIHIGLDLFMNMFDKRHGTKIEYKGGMTNLNTLYRVITSRLDPIRLINNVSFENREKDIRRRFHIIHKKHIDEKIDLLKLPSNFI